MSDYTTLKNLIDDAFKVEKVFGYKYKKWDNATRKMLISDRWEKDYQKKYTIDTDKGTLDLSASQLGSMLEASQEDGRADINGRTFAVKSNGKEGMEIRYYINLIKETDRAVGNDGWDVPPEEATISLDEIPF